MKRTILNKVILMMLSFIVAIVLLIIINKILVDARLKGESFIANEQGHLKLIEIAQSKFNELNVASYKISRLEDQRRHPKFEKQILLLLNEIDLISNTIIEGGTYTNSIKINVYNQDQLTEKIVYSASNEDFTTELIEFKPQITSIRNLTLRLLDVSKSYFVHEDKTQFDETRSIYKELESLLTRIRETANRSYLQVNTKTQDLNDALLKRQKHFNILRYTIILFILFSMILFLFQIIRQIYQLIDIHEQSKEELKTNNETIQKILDNLPVGIALATYDQKIKRINATALKLMNHAVEEEYIDKHCGNVFCLENEDECPLLTKNLPIHDIELGLKQKGGNTSTVLKSAIPIRLQNQDMILEAFMDISQQKAAEEELLEQKKFNDAVLNSALVGIIVIDAYSHEILSINEKAREMIEDDEANIIGNVCNNFICPADRGSCPISDLDQQVHNQHKKLITANKEEKHILKSVKKAEINGKEVFVESFIDISERIKAEQELQKLSKVVQESPNSIVITKKNGAIEYVNPTFEKTSGYTFEEVKDKNPRILNARVPENIVDYKQMWETINSGEIWKGEFCNRKKDGIVYWELASISPVKDNNGIITHFIAIKDDITDRKKFETELTIAKENADKANKAKSFFLAKMSHEIRTPMNGIMGMTDILMDGTEDDDLKEKLKVIGVSAENLLTIINEILDFSKIEAGQVELEQIPFNLDKMLREVEELLRIKAGEKSLFLKTRLSDQLPSCVVGDPTRVKQIIINLVNNAIKFTEEGGITIYLEKKKKSLKSNKFVLGISIIDTGIGISDEGKKKLFKAFSQTDKSTTRTHGGTGLGLLISKDLANLMGGSIGVDSQLEHGSTFWVEIPTEEATDQIKEQFRPLAEVQIKDKKLNILLAEDNKINQKIALINLEKLGHQVTIANNGEEAFEMFKERQFDLVLMDIQMPVMSGLEATGHIREFEKKNKKIIKTPIIALTANALTTDKDKYIAAGMNDYLSKPFKQQELVKVLAAMY